MNSNKRKVVNSNTLKKKTRLSKVEREQKQKQKAAAKKDLQEQAAQETEKVSDALKALQAADQKSAVHTYDAGKSLSNIKDDKLYRVEKTMTFKAFVGDKFKITEQYAYMLINAAAVQDILAGAGVAPEYVSEKLLRKLTPLRKTEEGRMEIVKIWRDATNGKADVVPTDKALADAVMASKQKSKPTAAKNKIDPEILDDPDADAKANIKLLRRVVDRKVRLGEDGLSKLRERLNTICDNAEPSEND